MKDTKLITCPSCTKQSSLKKWDETLDKVFRGNVYPLSKAIVDATVDRFYFVCPHCKDDIDGEYFDYDEIYVNKEV